MNDGVYKNTSGRWNVHHNGKKLKRSFGSRKSALNYFKQLAPKKLTDQHDDDIAMIGNDASASPYDANKFSSRGRQ